MLARPPVAAGTPALTYHNAPRRAGDALATDGIRAKPGPDLTEILTEIR